MDTTAMEAPSDSDWTSDLAGALVPFGVSGTMLKRLQADPILLHHVLVTRHDPEFLQHALRALQAATTTPGTSSQLIPSAEVITRAATALGRWAGSGFRKVDSAEVDRRLRCCMSCPNAREIEMSGVYRLLTSAKRERICTLCGCLLRHKATVASETCPDVASGPDGRWGV